MFKPNNKKMRKTILSFMACVLLGFSLAAQPALTDPLPRDPETVVGRLPNGITYYIRHNESPKGQACFYIIRNAGSLLEQPGEEGLAHFLEHMAFQGTKNFPGRGVIDALERHGVLYGYDINAVTNENETVYTISNVPTDDEKLLDTCVLILHDWSYYLTLDEKEIDEERGVITEEWHTRNTPEKRVQDQISEVIFQGSKYAGMDALGKLEVIQGFDPQALRDFYHKWYRTDLEAVAIVGDFNVKQMEKRVKKILSKVPAVKNPEPRPFFEVPDHEELYYCMATDPNAQGTSLMLITLVPDATAEQKATYAYLKDQTIVQLFNKMMGKRLGKAMAQEDSPLRNGGINYIYFKRGYYSYQIGAVPKQDEAAALRAILTENERMLRYGFTAEELEDAKKELLKTLGYTYRDRQNISNTTYAEQMRDAFLKGEPISGVGHDYEYLTKCIPAITAEEVHAKAKEWNTKKNRTFIVSGSEYGWHIMEDDVKAVMEEVAAATDIEPYRYEKEAVDNTPLFTETPKAGKIVAEKELPSFNAVEWTLDNGAKVVFRESGLAMNEVSLRAYSPGGKSLYNIDMLPSVEVTSQFVSGFGAGDYDVAALQKKLAGKNVSCDISINLLSENITGKAVPEDVETLLQLVYMRFMHPRFDSVVFQQSMAQNMMMQMMMGQQSSPQGIIQDSVTVLQGGYHPRVLLKDADYLGKISFDKIKQVYTERFSNAADFTFFITGSLTADELKPLVEKYIGSIPSTGKKEQWVDHKMYGLQGKNERVIHIPAPQPMAMVIVSLSKRMDYSFRNNICNAVLKNALQTRCMASMREKDGGTYAVNVHESSSFEPVGQYGMSVEFQCAPENAQRMKAQVHQELERLKAEGPTEGEVQRALANLRKEQAASKGKNDYWMQAMLMYYKTGMDSTLPASFDDIVRNLTADDVRAYINDFLTDNDNIDVIFTSQPVD